MTDALETITMAEYVEKYMNPALKGVAAQLAAKRRRMHSVWFPMGRNFALERVADGR